MPAAGVHQNSPESSLTVSHERSNTSLAVDLCPADGALVSATADATEPEDTLASAEICRLVEDFAPTAGEASEI